MNTSRKAEAAGAETPLRINLEGPPELVKQLLAAIAGAVAPAEQEPTQLYLTVPEVARRTGIHEDRLRGWVKAGKLKNYNTSGRMLLSLADVRQAAGD